MYVLCDMKSSNRVFKIVIWILERLRLGIIIFEDFLIEFYEAGFRLNSDIICYDFNF